MKNQVSKHIKRCWKQAVQENWLEGIRLSFFGGSIRENIAYLKAQNTAKKPSGERR